MCYGLGNSNGKVLFDESEHPWTSMCLTTYQPNATDYKAKAEILHFGSIMDGKTMIKM